MANKEPTVKTSLYTKRVVFYWLSFFVGYVVPLIVFLGMFGFGTERTVVRVAFPVLIAIILLMIKVMIDLPKWTKTWRPSFAKGLLMNLPKILIFGSIILVYYIIKVAVTSEIASFVKQIETTIWVLSGCQIAGAFFNAFHIKYKQLDLIEKGYVLGSINNE